MMHVRSLNSGTGYQWIFGGVIVIFLLGSVSVFLVIFVAILLLAKALDYKKMLWDSQKKLYKLRRYDTFTNLRGIYETSQEFMVVCVQVKNKYAESYKFRAVEPEETDVYVSYVIYGPKFFYLFYSTIEKSLAIRYNGVETIVVNGQKKTWMVDYDEEDGCLSQWPSTWSVIETKIFEDEP